MIFRPHPKSVKDKLKHKHVRPGWFIRPYAMQPGVTGIIGKAFGIIAAT
jgi:hypothetical protein